MGRHGSQHSGGLRVGRVRISLTVIALCILLLAIIGLGTWWWFQRSATDPIDAHPVSSTATVISSPSCTGAGHTVVQVSGMDTKSQLDGCGFTTGQLISVEYLAGHPAEVRLAGTTRAGGSSLARTIVPIAILIGGMAAAVGLVAASRAGSRRPRGGSMTVAQLRARMAAASTAPVEPPPAGPAESADAADVDTDDQ